ncbi:MAG: hypothetical protein WCK57_12660 [Verrucomicrobiae bacterium]
MDATQKRKVKKVATAHFVLTALIFVKWMCLENEDYIQSIVFAGFWRDILYLLQPQIWLAVESGNHFSTEIFSMLFPPWVYLLTIPIWSICFGWLFVKLDNWLNHFPVLGKRVF